MGTALSPRIALLAVAAACIVHVVASLLFHSITWDDSAITLGFARTFALSGEIRPTPLSDRVEGFSTPLWMFVNAAAYAALKDSDSLLLFAKAASLALNLANILFVFVLMRAYCAPTLAALIAFLFSAQSVMFYESINGMEHPLFVFLMLATFWGYLGKERASRFVVFLAASTLVVTIRWEGLWFVAPFFLRSVVEGGPRRIVAAEHLLWAAAFAGLTAFRFAYFGDLVPNTIIAKSNPPYALDGLSLWTRFNALGAAFLPVLPCVIVTGALALAQRGDDAGRSAAVAIASGVWRRRDLFCIAMVVAAGLTFVLAIGENWGPRSRLFLPALPFAFLGAAALLGGMAARAEPRLRLSAQAGLFAVGLITLALSFHELSAPAAPRYMERVTVANIATVAPALDKIRRASGRETLTVASPDMGGLLLYSDHLRVIDIGFLCNRDLAKRGHAGIRSIVFERENADVIAVHSLWSRSVAGLDPFYDGYVPMFVDGLRFFVRHDLAHGMRTAAEHPFDSGGDARHYDRGSVFFAHQNRTDFEINRRFGRYLALSAGR
jgi:hypothetical protein